MAKKMSDFFMAAVVMIFIISTAVLFTVSFKPLYYFEIDNLNIEDLSGYSEIEIRSNYDILIDYNLSPFQTKLEFPSFPMSAEGEIHFQEVKDIFQFILKLFIVSTVVAVIGSVCKVRRRDYRYLKWASIITIVLPATVGSMVAIYWDKTFVLFHEIVFDNDYWMFDPVTDPVITILPDVFFMHCALMIVGIVALGSFVCYFLWRYKSRIIEK